MVDGGFAVWLMGRWVEGGRVVGCPAPAHCTLHPDPCILLGRNRPDGDEGAYSGRFSGSVGSLPVIFLRASRASNLSCLSFRASVSAGTAEAAACWRSPRAATASDR